MIENKTDFLQLKIKVWREYCESLIEIQSLHSKMKFVCYFPDTGRDGFTEKEVQKEIDQESQKLECIKNKLLNLGEKLPINEDKLLYKYSLTNEESDNYVSQLCDKMEQATKEAAETRWVTTKHKYGYSIKKYNINDDKEILTKIDRKNFWRENGLFIGTGLFAGILIILVLIQKYMFPLLHVIIR